MPYLMMSFTALGGFAYFRYKYDKHPFRVRLPEDRGEVGTFSHIVRRVIYRDPQMSWLFLQSPNLSSPAAECTTK